MRLLRCNFRDHTNICCLGTDGVRTQAISLAVSLLPTHGLASCSQGLQHSKGLAHTFQLLLSGQLHLLLAQGGVDGPEVGHDSQEVLEVDLIGQATGSLAQVPKRAARGGRASVHKK